MTELRPPTPDDRLPGTGTRRRLALVLGLAVLVLTVALLLTLRGGREGAPLASGSPSRTSTATSDPTAPSADTTASTGTTAGDTTPGAATSSVTGSATASPGSSAPPATTRPSPAGPSTTPTDATPSTDPVTPPSGVTTLSAGPGGGSGEVTLDWQSVPNATVYRVYRADTAGGPWSLSASVDVASGTTTVAIGAERASVQIWQPSAGTYEYVEAGIGPGPVYLRVAGVNAGGEGPASATVCGTPVGGPPC